VKNVRIIRPGLNAETPPFLNPSWKAHAQRFPLIRFLDWTRTNGNREVLAPVIARYRGRIRRRYFRADAAFANPHGYKLLEAEGQKYTIRLPANPGSGRISPGGSSVRSPSLRPSLPPPASWQFLLLYSPKCQFLTAANLGGPPERIQLRTGQPGFVVMLLFKEMHPPPRGSDLSALEFLPTRHPPGGVGSAPP
jgi:hypothetical protein